jgi:hypothetical protein
MGNFLVIAFSPNSNFPTTLLGWLNKGGGGGGGGEKKSFNFLKNNITS